jgi:hypothetical protein
MTRPYRLIKGQLEFFFRQEKTLRKLGFGHSLKGRLESGIKKPNQPQKSLPIGFIGNSEN